VLVRHLPVAIGNVARIRRTQRFEQLSIGKAFQRRNVGFESARTFKGFVSGLGYRIVTLAKLVKYAVIRNGRSGYRMSDHDKRETEDKSDDSHAVFILNIDPSLVHRRRDTRSLCPIVRFIIDWQQRGRSGSMKRFGKPLLEYDNVVVWDSNPKQRPRILMLHISNLSANAKQFCHDIPDMVGRRRHFAGNYISGSHRLEVPTYKKW
jgi:hypothetical protein